MSFRVGQTQHRTGQLVHADKQVSLELMPACRSQAGYSCSGCDPIVVSAERQAKPVIMHAQISVAAARDCIGPDHADLLRHHADPGLLASVIGKAIVAQAILQMAEQHDVMLERNIGAAPAAATAKSAAATTAESATTAAAESAAATTAKTAATSGAESTAAAVECRAMSAACNASASAMTDAGT